MSSLLDILRDLYVRSVATLACKTLEEYIQQNCYGCNVPESVNNHDLCRMMEWPKLISTFLPNILKKMTPQEISKAIRTTYKSDEQLQNALKDKVHNRSGFSMRTFLYICFKDMCSDMNFQIRIAQAIYATVCHPVPKAVQTFEEYYRMKLR